MPDESFAPWVARSAIAAPALRLGEVGSQRREGSSNRGLWHAHEIERGVEGLKDGVLDFGEAGPVVVWGDSQLEVVSHPVCEHTVARGCQDPGPVKRQSQGLAEQGPECAAKRRRLEIAAKVVAADSGVQRRGPLDSCLRRSRASLARVDEFRQLEIERRRQQVERGR